MTDWEREDNQNYDPYGNRRQESDRGSRERARPWRSSYGENERRDDYRGENDFSERDAFERPGWQENERSWNEQRYRNRQERDYQQRGRGFRQGSRIYDQRDARGRDQESSGYNRSRYDQEAYRRGSYERGEQWLYDPYQNERDYTYNQYRNRYDRDTNRDYDWQNRQRYGYEEEGRRGGSEGYRTAGMQSDDVSGRSRDWYRNTTSGLQQDRDRNRSRYSDRYSSQDAYNFAEGDVGFDSEGAFYQDLDEPENQEVWEFWEIPGRFTGIGPEGYRRSDENIEEAICKRLTWHGRIDATNINVSVHDGEVTLTGNVPQRDMKRLAEDVADHISGVRDVHNQIRVNEPQRNDENRWNQRSGESRYHQESGDERGQNTVQQEARGERYDTARDRDNQPSTTSQGERLTTAVDTPAGESTMGAGITSAGATSLSGMEAVNEQEQIKRNLREGMEVLAKNGKVVGRVKEIRREDFLVDRDMARDIYIPYSAVRSVGADALLEVEDSEVDQQGWKKPDLFGGSGA